MAMRLIRFAMRWIAWPDARHSVRGIATLVLAACGAWLCVQLATPLPWLIGPLVATSLASIAGAPVAASPLLRNAGQWAIGVALGLYFTPHVMSVVLAQAPAIVIGIAWALALGAAFAAFLRCSNTDLALDRATLHFASAIGGASEMAVLAERHGARADLVAAAHSLRIVLVVIIVPFGFRFAGLEGLDPAQPGPHLVHAGGLLALMALTVAGALAMQRFDWPNAWVLGPLATALTLTASGIEWSALPVWMTNLGQLFIGTALGVRFTPGFVGAAPRWLATVALGTVAMMLASALFAYALARASGLHPATVLLGTSPGGIAEMCLTAQALQLGVPIVTAFHVTRMAAVVVLAEPLYRLAQRRHSA